MVRRIADPDLSAAALFAVAGAVGIVATRGLPIGSTMRMGPGYLPLAVSILLLLLAAGLALRAVARRHPAEAPRWSLGPIAAVVASLGAFAVLIEPGGLVGATAALLAMSRLADRPFRPWETVLVTLAGAAFSALVFVALLQLAIPLWPA